MFGMKAIRFLKVTTLVTLFSVLVGCGGGGGGGGTSTTTPPVENTAPLVSIEQGLTALTLEEGEQKSFTFVVDFTDGSASEYVVELEHLFDAAGFSISSDYPTTGWEANEDKQWTVNLTLTAVTAGEYTLTSTVSTNTGESYEVTLPITITSSESATTLSAPGADKDAIAPDSAEEIVFTSKFFGSSSAPDTLALDQVNIGGDVIVAELGILLDDGSGEDLVAGDLVYTGTVSLPASAVGDLYFQASSGDLISTISKVSVTEFPTTTAVSDPSALIADDNGNQIYSNELLVKFSDDTSAERIQEIVTSASGAIVGSIMSLDIYQIQIETSTSLALLDQAIQTLEAYAEVEYAEYSAQTSVDTFPDDSYFSNQSNMTNIRADEAWYISNSNTFISIIDTGVDYSHEELDSKIVKGKDFVSADDDPMDEDGHGTHVAGIMVAEANNGEGIAGLAWDSQVIAVRGLGGSYAALLSAIRYSTDRGAKVINISGGAYLDSNSLESAVTYAMDKGALVVSAAGNDSRNEPKYPCYYESVFCVANTTNANGRASSSNYGEWVDISAPGQDIASTQLGGGIIVKSGTSMSAALISGAAAMVWTKHPEWTAEKIRTRLVASGKKLGSELLVGSARLDVFEALFNGSFEIGDLAEWKVSGTASSIKQLASLLPVAGNRMAFVSTGGGVETTMTKSITIQPGVTELPIEFTYNFLTAEYPDYIGGEWDDLLKITLTLPDGTEQELVSSSVKEAEFTLVDGLAFNDGNSDKGDDTVGQTGFKTIRMSIPVTEGKGEYSIHISDQGDGLYDSAILIDNIRFK